MPMTSDRETINDLTNRLHEAQAELAKATRALGEKEIELRVAREELAMQKELTTMAGREAQRLHDANREAQRLLHTAQERIRALEAESAHWRDGAQGMTDDELKAARARQNTPEQAMLLRECHTSELDFSFRRMWEAYDALRATHRPRWYHLRLRRRQLVDSQGIVPARWYVTLASGAWMAVTASYALRHPIRACRWLLHGETP